VIAPYRNSPACAWLMRDATIATVRKLKDSQNQYLWQPSMQIGAPDVLLGKPVFTDPNVAATATSAKSVIFGDMSAYYVRIAGGIRFERSDDFAFQSDLVTFRCIVRGDGILADQTGAVKVFAGGAS
jgi:HK97 family phage major capsid protein